MDAQDFRSLQEAYMEVVENQQLDEAERVTRIRGEFKNPQPLNPLPKSPRKSGMEKLEQGRKAFNKSKEVASRNLMRQKESVDLYDIILSHLLDEGYAETPESAEAIMVNMSEEWRQSIVEGDALQNTIKRLEGKRDAMNREKPGSANTAAPGKQSVGAATYSAYQRLRGV